jgi:hypothetical protein
VKKYIKWSGVVSCQAAKRTPALPSPIAPSGLFFSEDQTIKICEAAFYATASAATAIACCVAPRAAFGPDLRPSAVRAWRMSPAGTSPSSLALLTSIIDVTDCTSCVHELLGFFKTRPVAIAGGLDLRFSFFFCPAGAFCGLASALASKTLCLTCRAC